MDAVAKSLLDRGYALVRDDGELMPMVGRMIEEARSFFAQDDAAKLAASTPSRLEGYRPMGAEFSDNPEETDLCEFFSVWHWNQGNTEIEKWARANRLHAAMTMALPGFARVADGVLEALRARLNPNGQRVDVTEASYLQVNHYRPREFDRELLQGPHEDGHVLTIHKATGHGLEIRSDDRFHALAIADDEFLILPGSLLTLITGGALAPLFHQVRNDKATGDRQALLYFVNPSMVQETRPWIVTDANRDLSVLAIARACIGAR